MCPNYFGIRNKTTFKYNYDEPLHPSVYVGKKTDLVLCVGNEICLYKHPTINKLDFIDKLSIISGIIFWFITQIFGNLI